MIAVPAFSSGWSESGGHRALPEAPVPGSRGGTLPPAGARASARGLQLPRGAESLHLEDAYVHHQLVRRIFSLFTGWGYLPLETPVLDFFDIYQPLLDDGAVQQVYRLVDREGDLLMLRSDITLFLAKQVAVALEGMRLPVRVCYFDTILRHHDREEMSRNEFYQVGAELVGRRGARANLEVLALLNRLLEELGLVHAVVHVGSRRLLEACLPQAGSDAQRALRRAVLARDWPALGELFGGQAGLAARARELFSCIATPQEFARDLDTRRVGWPRPVTEELEQVAELVTTAAQLAPPGRFRIDLSEVGSQPYHSGLVFSVYTPGVGTAIAAGGRYDRLLGTFGRAAPAAGFSLLLRTAEPAMQARAELLPPRDVTEVKHGDFVAGYRRAEQIRAGGGVAVL